MGAGWHAAFELAACHDIALEHQPDLGLEQFLQSNRPRLGAAGNSEAETVRNVVCDASGMQEREERVPSVQFSSVCCSSSIAVTGDQRDTVPFALRLLTLCICTVQQPPGHSGSQQAQDRRSLVTAASANSELQAHLHLTSRSAWTPGEARARARRACCP